MFYLPLDFPKVDINFLKSITHYLREHPQSILRQIKKDFPQQENLEEELEKFIQLGLITRNERRYQSVVSYFPTDFLWEEFLKEALAPLVKQILTTEKLTILDVWETFKLPPRTQLLEVTKTQKQAMDAYLVTSHTFLGKYQVIEIQTQQSQTTFTNFFAKKEDTPALKKLTHLVGDVVPDYFLQQSLPKLWRAQEKPLRESRPDIFTDALVIMGLLTPEKITNQVLFTKETPVENGLLKTKFEKILATFPFKEQPAVFQQLQLLAQGYLFAQLKAANYFTSATLPLESGWHVTILKKKQEEEKRWNTIASL